MSYITATIMLNMGYLYFGLGLLKPNTDSALRQRNYYPTRQVNDTVGWLVCPVVVFVKETDFPNVLPLILENSNFEILEICNSLLSINVVFRCFFCFHSKDTLPIKPFLKNYTECHIPYIKTLILYAKN